jgi:multidrug resistance efflux pump
VDGARLHPSAIDVDLDRARGAVFGRIQDLLVDFNSSVKKGDVVARIDPRLFKAAVAQAEANALSKKENLEKAEVQLEDAQRQAKRADELAARGLISESDHDATPRVHERSWLPSTSPSSRGTSTSVRPSPLRSNRRRCS